MNLRKMQADFADRLRNTRIVRAIHANELSKAQYAAYMADVYIYACHSSQVIGHAASRLVLSHPPLADYLFHHAQEEMGHERWAASDLRDLGKTDEDIAAIEPSSPCLRMLGLEYLYAFHDNPVGLFGWMFVLESLGGSVGGDIAKALDQALALEGKATYFLRGHGEADTHHSEDLFRVISENITSDTDKAAFQAMTRESDDLYRQILDTALASTSSGNAPISAA